MATEEPEGYRRRGRYFIRIGRLYQKRKVRIYTGIVLSIFTIAFFLFFAIRPTFVTIAGLLKEIKDKRTINEQLEDKISALNLAQIEYQQVEKDLYLLDEALPINSDLSAFIRQVEVLARRDNVTINSLQFEATILKGEETTAKAAKAKRVTESEEIGQEMGFNLVISGDYSQLKSFLNNLTRLRRLVLVDAFTFQAGEEGGGLVLSLNANAHYFEQGKKQ